MTDDLELLRVISALRSDAADQRRWASVLRHTFDSIYNGQETGRFSWEQLMKTEKTHFGTLFEIFAQREFAFENGDATDYRIAGVEVDARWSQRFGGWMLPPEVTDHLALVATASDSDALWSLGVVRVKPEFRTRGTNRDAKSTLNEAGRAAIQWLWKNAPLPQNVLLRLRRADVDQLFDIAGGVHRIAELFRLAEGQLVGRSAILTVAQQLDAMRRIRGGSNGARQVLAPEGYLVLSGTYHQAAAKSLGLPIPARDEYVAHRVVPDPMGVRFGNDSWRLARAGEAIREMAPIVPMKWTDISDLSQ